MKLKEKVQLHKMPNQKNWAVLVDLYLIHGTSQTYKRVIAQASFNRAKFGDLLYEISKIDVDLQGEKIISPDPVRKPVQKVVLVPTVQAKKENREPVKIRKTDNEIIKLEERKSLLFREYVTLFHSLEMKSSDADRVEPIRRIKEIWTDIQEIWTDIHHFEIHGSLPVKQTDNKLSVSNLSVKELVEKSRNLPTNISRNKKKRDQATTEATRQKYQARIERDEYELMIVNKRINEL